MSDSRTTELCNRLRDVGNLHEFAELFGFNWTDDSDWTWHDVAVKMADDVEQAIAATLGNGECELEPLSAIDVTLNMLNVVGWCVCSKCGYATPDDSNYCQNCGRKVVHGGS